jgi:hypothetical protein
MTVQTETRNVQDFTYVALKGFGDLVIEQKPDAPEALTIEAEADVLRDIRSEVRGGRLILDYDIPWWDFTRWLSWSIRPNKSVHFHVSLKAFDGCSVIGAGDVTLGPVQTEACKLRISGAGKLHAERIEAQSLDTHISGAGDLQMAGAVQRHELHISGSGDVKAADLQTQQTQVSISGSGDARLNVQEELKVTISGAGKVRYSGQPKVSRYISGVGHVAQI